ncbi:hypothetical protein [Streptococcus mutans]|uniref:hypothetical protein n=1 Tax=Streptococcus mutans TaxID=1309 RepID=UPI0014554316|nr:hypothetical protein [Streptococcus mutans]NLQ50461.1 hypothetical protein [Streptococcus mutans]
MNKKSIFKASFEESLNLEDDGFLQYQKRDIFYKSEKYYKKGKPTIVLRIQSFILFLIGPIGINFMILVFSLSLHDSDPKDLRLPVSQYPLLTVEVYLICLLIWLLLVLVGKFFRRPYILPYRSHFHVITFLVWLSLEFNLLAIDISLPTLSVWLITAIFVLLSVLAYLMFTLETKSLRKLMYGIVSGSTLRDKIANKIAVYGMGILGIGVIINFILKSFSINFSTSIEGLGLFLMWIILNLAVIAMFIFLELPYYLQAYYKWKYPEEYREWEGKSLEEWYGKRYLKKHKELLQK